MTIKKEIKELKVGTKTVHNLEYLRSLKADFFTGGNNLELLDEWNHLQKTPSKTRIFTFADKSKPHKIAKYLENNYPFNRHPNEVGEYVFDTVPQAPFYAYIKHDKDMGYNSPEDIKNPEMGIHYHFYLEYKNARSFASVATELGIPVTLLQGIKVSKSAILQYLTHENDPNKHHYSPDEIHANFNVVEARDTAQFDIAVLWEDVWAMCEGKMSRTDFLMKYNRHCATLSFSQNVKLAMDVYKFTDTRGGRL